MTLTLAEAVPLLHAHVAAAAEATGTRVLLVKGPLVIELGLRAPRGSVDVDALVDPARYRQFREALFGLGWQVYSDLETSPTPQLTPGRVCTTLHHDAWPATIDLHGNFPGMLTDDQAAFEALWSRRRTAPIANTEVCTTDSLGTAVIVGLHALRSPHKTAMQSELAVLSDVLDRDLTADDRGELGELAAQVGATQTLQPLLGRLGCPMLGTSDRSAVEEWSFRTRLAAKPGALWLLEFRRTPFHRWPALLRRALLLPDDVIRHSPYFDRAHPSVGRAHLRRLAHGVRVLVRARA